VLILGINFFHSDSAACLVMNGRVVAAVAQERLGKRIKHDSAFPADAIGYVLSRAGVQLKDVDVIAIPRDQSKSRVERIYYGLSQFSIGPIKAFIEASKRDLSSINLSRRIADALGQSLDTDIPVINVEHHLAHIASAFFCSPGVESATGLSYDGSGDFVSGMIAECQGPVIKVRRRIHLPNSLGFFYSAICQFIGFRKFGEEYKVMGLAPYGEDSYDKEMAKLLRTDDKGYYSLDRQYFQMHSGGSSGTETPDTLYTPKMEKLFNMKSFSGELPISKVQEDLARSAQVRFQKAVTRLADTAMRLGNSDHLVTAGGCALN